MTESWTYSSAGNAVIGSVPEPEAEVSAPQESPLQPKTYPHDLRIDALGRSFIITAGEDPDFLEEVLSQYQFAIANTQGISGMKDDPLKVAILTGFLLCAEINKIKMQVEEDRADAEMRQEIEVRELERITRNMIACIDQVIEKTDLLND